MYSAAAPLIFLVDDDPNDQELARIALEKSNLRHELKVFRDGAEALAELQKTTRTTESMPHLVLLDLKLPKVTGLEVLERLRADDFTKSLPIVVFTSSVEDRDVTLSYDLGANAYIRKPNDFTEYKATVADMGRFWVLRNESPMSLLKEVKNG